MVKSLGERIKALRKDAKMTQTDLAGTEMTKSMLSQIENNLATPSMKNMQYIAARLGRPMSYFLEDDSYRSTLPVEEVRESLKEVRQLLDTRRNAEALAKLEEIQSKYKLDHDSKLYADFLASYGEGLIEFNKNEEGTSKIKEAVEIYKSKFLYIEAAKVHQNLMAVYWNRFEYDHCLSILEESLSIYGASINKDYTFEIEALYIRAILMGGLDQLEESIQATEEALAISKHTNIYYRSDELYKNMAVMNAFLGRLEHFNEYMDKGRQFAQFTENHTVLASIEGICGMYQIEMGQPLNALNYLEQALKYSEKAWGFVYTEKAKALYLLKRYDESLAAVRQVEYPSYTPFKYDYLHLWSSKIYEGLSLHKLGKQQEALQCILSSIEKMDIVGVSKSLAFAYKSLSEVYSGSGDYEKAFAALKKSNELEELAQKNKLYY